jgi:hypothetical protein
MELRITLNSAITNQVMELRITLSSEITNQVMKLRITLNSAITNQVMELQRDMDEAKAPIALQNKALSRLFGGRANASDATNYTSMGLAQLLALEESPCVKN